MLVVLQTLCKMEAFLVFALPIRTRALEVEEVQTESRLLSI